MDRIESVVYSLLRYLCYIKYYESIKKNIIKYLVDKNKSLLRYLCEIKY